MKGLGLGLPFQATFSLPELYLFCAVKSVDQQESKGYVYTFVLLWELSSESNRGFFFSSENSNEWGNETVGAFLSQTLLLKPTGCSLDDDGSICFMFTLSFWQGEGKILNVNFLIMRWKYFFPWDNCWKPSVSLPLSRNDFGSCEMKNYYSSEKLWHERD